MQTRRTASWLAERMSKDGHTVAVLSGDLTVEQRIAVLDRFREGMEKVLITTNVLARGIILQFNNDYNKIINKICLLQNNFFFFFLIRN